jgi:uncharacterized protein
MPIIEVDRARTGPLSRPETVTLAILSALAEEIAFRGALQHWLGMEWAAAIFALLHLGPTRGMRLWTLYALGGGLLFGALQAARGALLAPIVGHLIVNLVQLQRLADGRAREGRGLRLDG